VASAWRTAARAAATAAREPATVSARREVSSSTSTWPCRTRSLMSTCTLATVPDSSLPMATCLVGCKVPLAVTDTVSAPRITACVS
jgi:hypothetical protein